MITIQRQHRNGWTAKVRIGGDGTFQAVADPPHDGQARSIEFSSELSESAAMRQADQYAHRDCEDADDCAGQWQEVHEP